MFSDSEREANSFIKKFQIISSDDKNYNTRRYSLPAIITVGYKVNSAHAVQFRKWAKGIIDAAHRQHLRNERRAYQGRHFHLHQKVFQKEVAAHPRISAIESQAPLGQLLNMLESVAQRKIPINIQDWENCLILFIETTDRRVFQNTGKFTKKNTKPHAESYF